MQNNIPANTQTELSEANSSIVAEGPVERAVGTTGLALFMGGATLSLLKPEIGNLVMGVGVGLTIGALSVGFASRHGNG